jgi:hypothetical protein
MTLGLYQDWAPPKLGSRVLGKEGKELIRNLSIDSLRGNYDVRMKPDMVAGSKSLERQVKLWGFENLQQTIWFDPRVNPKGNWNLVVETAKAIGYTDVEKNMPPEPKAETGASEEVENEFVRMAQGEIVEITKIENPVEHYFGHMKQKEERYYELDEEYRPNFDAHLFKTAMAFNNFIRQKQAEKMADQMAMGMIRDRDAGIRDEVDYGPAGGVRQPVTAGVRPAPGVNQNPGMGGFS